MYPASATRAGASAADRTDVAHRQDANEARRVANYATPQRNAALHGEGLGVSMSAGQRRAAASLGKRLTKGHMRSVGGDDLRKRADQRPVGRSIGQRLEASSELR